MAAPLIAPCANRGHTAIPRSDVRTCHAPTCCHVATGLMPRSTRVATSSLVVSGGSTRHDRRHHGLSSGRHALHRARIPRVVSSVCGRRAQQGRTDGSKGAGWRSSPFWGAEASAWRDPGARGFQGRLAPPRGKPEGISLQRERLARGAAGHSAGCEGAPAATSAKRANSRPQSPLLSNTVRISSRRAP